VSTAPDYLRFAQMMLNGGQLDGRRLISRTTVRLMTADHLGKIADTMRTPGYTFGLGFAVRTDYGLGAQSSSPGEFNWAGAGGTFFWVDPKEELIAILMTQARGRRACTTVNCSGRWCSRPSWTNARSAKPGQANRPRPRGCQSASPGSTASPSTSSVSTPRIGSTTSATRDVAKASRSPI